MISSGFREIKPPTGKPSGNESSADEVADRSTPEDVAEKMCPADNALGCSKGCQAQKGGTTSRIKPAEGNRKGDSRRSMGGRGSALPAADGKEWQEAGKGLGNI